tara:strand:+ start:132 stop:299 length:168 start_codon:yes stop_codon:yes gene_type:complete
LTENQELECVAEDYLNPLTMVFAAEKVLMRIERYILGKYSVFNTNPSVGTSLVDK